MLLAALECAMAYVVEFLKSVWKASQSERNVEKSSDSVSLMVRSSSSSSRSTTALKASSSSSSGSTAVVVLVGLNLLVGISRRTFSEL